jgi:hypothetical protein
MGNAMWAMALVEFGVLALVVGIVVWAVRKKPGNKSDQDES